MLLLEVAWLSVGVVADVDAIAVDVEAVVEVFPRAYCFNTLFTIGPCASMSFSRIWKEKRKKIIYIN